MQILSANRTGIVLGVFLGAFHAMWALFVAFGWAQPIIDFVFWMHMIKPVYVIGPFNPWTGLVLIAVTSTVGYIAGILFAALWNWLHTESRQVAPQQRSKLTPVAR